MNLEKKKHAGLPRWVERYQFMVAMVVFLLIVIPAFVAIERANSKTDALSECIIEHSTAQTDALQDRDSVSRVEIAAGIEVWTRILRFLRDPSSGGSRKLIKAVKRNRNILIRVDNAAVANPYSDIADCLEKIDPDLVPKEKDKDPVQTQSNPFKPVAYVMDSSKWDDYCFGKRVTIRGTRGSDVIHGTDGNDVIFAYSGDDVITGGKGSDRICGRWGDDTIHAGQGYDRVAGGRGTDFCLQAEVATGCE